jgi:hypothetical protein
LRAYMLMVGANRLSFSRGGIRKRGLMSSIQTVFNDRRFRSRLEARYAVLLHTCGLVYQYEREGFDLPLRKYLPDFWLPTLGIWLEVKGWTATDLEKQLCQNLADEQRRRVVMACGDPSLGTIVGCFMPDADGLLMQMLPDFLMQWISPNIVLEAISLAQSSRFEFGETPKVVSLTQPNRPIQNTAAR